MKAITVLLMLVINVPKHLLQLCLFSFLFSSEQWARKMKNLIMTQNNL